MKPNRKLTFMLSLISITLILTLANTVEAGPPILNLTTKPLHTLGEKITVTGNITADGTLITDALVTIQVLDPRSETIVLRALTTGSNPPSSYTPIEILEFYPCDSAENPKYSFKRGGDMGFKIKIKNNAATSYTIKVPIYIQFSNGLPYKVFEIYSGTINPQQTISTSTWPVPIPSNAPLGTTKAYANVIDEYPNQNGRAYALEKNTTFQITASTSSTSYDYTPTQTTEGTFTTSFITNPYGGILGNYTIHATSLYLPYLLTAKTTTKVALIGDITGSYGVPDNKVDMKDVALVSKAFGQTVPPADPKCDLDKNGKIEMKDIAIVSKDFGKYGTLP